MRDLEHHSEAQNHESCHGKLYQRRSALDLNISRVGGAVELAEVRVHVDRAIARDAVVVIVVAGVKLLELATNHTKGVLKRLNVEVETLLDQRLEVVVIEAEGSAPGGESLITVDLDVQVVDLEAEPSHVTFSSTEDAGKDGVGHVVVHFILDLSHLRVEAENATAMVGNGDRTNLVGARQIRPVRVIGAQLTTDHLDTLADGDANEHAVGIEFE
mmetsp:Transcript_37990/g.53025  ORF Transcript_37990/g.53025 Transcript_37990/m.53025 type:complete len:215 (+) Transcript_37990:110-754(+)